MLVLSSAAATAIVIVVVLALLLLLLLKLRLFSLLRDVRQHAKGMPLRHSLRNSKTPPNFVPKTYAQSNPKKGRAGRCQPKEPHVLPRRLRD